MENGNQNDLEDYENLLPSENEDQPDFAENKNGDAAKK